MDWNLIELAAILAASILGVSYLVYDTYFYDPPKLPKV